MCTEMYSAVVGRRSLRAQSAPSVADCCYTPVKQQPGLSKVVVTNLKSPTFGFLVFFRKTLNIQILDSQSQQKIVAFQSN